ncbi:MAG: Hint domain-containing protein [Rhodobacteraceae bacterium]|nr:MAG: Hint domain-containing protein [Paracoccaceae bacterium]
MPVTNATFDFDGPDVSKDTAVFKGGPTSGTLTEQGITFSFSANPGSGAYSFSAAFALSVSSGSAMLSIDDTPDEEFFSNLVFDFHSSVAGTNSIILSRTKTDDGALLTTPVVTTIPSTQIVANAIVNAPAGKWNTIQFNSSPLSFMVLDSITATVNCFLGDTRIATQDGATPVQDLRAGDMVQTADGRFVKVLWLGEMTIDTALMHPARVNPICITAGALGGGLPLRDLHVSPDHAIEIDGTLYNAGALVNGETIHQVARMPREGFTYYHVETEAHELLLAEGVAAESYIDYAGRDSFDNAPAGEGRVIAEMPLPRVSARRLVPETLIARLAQARPAETIAA